MNQSPSTSAANNSLDWGVWAMRGSGSVLGPHATWLKSQGNVVLFESEEAAAKYALELNRSVMSVNVSYEARRFR